MHKPKRDGQYESFILVTWASNTRVTPAEHIAASAAFRCVLPLLLLPWTLMTYKFRKTDPAEGGAGLDPVLGQLCQR